MTTMCFVSLCPSSFLVLVTHANNVSCIIVASLCQGSEVPSLGTFSGTVSGKWAKVGKMGENGGK